jgi:zinc protease
MFHPISSLPRRCRGVLAALLAVSSPTSAQSPVDIAFQKFVLPNGLTLLVHEDHKAPIVAVNVWYHVGSKNERPGRTGFAHLFEHLMFNGSEHYDKEFQDPLERAGATDLNGTTNEDRTNYFENVPTSAVDLTLWLESDRMGHFANAITDAKLAEQRGVVQNEKREGENAPYGKVWDFLTPKLYPPNHPYSWTTIGSMEDLNAATLEDVREWFRTYYGAANAVVVVAGDIHPDSARSKVERYFGDVPPGPPIARQGTWIARRTGSQRGIMQDRVPEARVYQVWNVPQWGSPDGDYLDLVSDVLSTGKSSRFYQRLVYQDRIATSVSASVDLREIGGLFVIQASVRSGVDPARVERALNEELARLVATGPTAAELRRVKTRYRAGFIRGVERIGGFGGKSDVLARGEIFAGRPDFYRVQLRRVAGATPSLLRRAAARWLTDGDYTLEVLPFPRTTVAPEGVDRTRLPKTGTPPSPAFPRLERAVLSNGLHLVLAERPSIPQIRFDLLLDAGYASDQFALPGTASLAMTMLDEGTETRNALEISDRLAELGANLGAGSRLDVSSVSLEALREHLDPSLELYADVILHPAFRQEDLDRLKQQRLAQIQREKADPVGMAIRVFPRLIYGAGHAYAIPWTGSGTEGSTERITREDLIHFHQSWFKPNHATMVVVGATTMAEIRPKLERLFDTWAPGETPAKEIGPVPPQATSSIYLLDRPGSLQSIIIAGDAAPPKANPDEPAIEAMNAVLGSDFGSRLNMNLREEKHWAYGAFSFLRDARGERPFIVYAPVQTDKTREAMVEVLKELRGIVGDRAIEPQEMERAKASLTLTLPGSLETMGALASIIGEIVTFGLDDRYYDSYGDKVRALTPAAVTSAAKRTVRPDHLVWVVVGDRAKIEPGLRQLEFGEIHLIDADGNPVSGP